MATFKSIVLWAVDIAALAVIYALFELPGLLIALFIQAAVLAKRYWNRYVALHSANLKTQSRPLPILPASFETKHRSVPKRIFGWILDKFYDLIGDKAQIKQVRELFQTIGDAVDEHEHVRLLDALLASLASKELDADTAIEIVATRFADSEYGEELDELARSLPGGKEDNWREALVAISKLRGELAALVAHPILTKEVDDRVDEATAHRLLEAGEGLIARYREGRPLRFVREALERG